MVSGYEALNRLWFLGGGQPFGGWWIPMKIMKTVEWGLGGPTCWKCHLLMDLRCAFMARNDMSIHCWWILKSWLVVDHQLASTRPLTTEGAKGSSASSILFSSFLLTRCAFRMAQFLKTRERRPKWIDPIPIPSPLKKIPPATRMYWIYHICVPSWWHLVLYWLSQFQDSEAWLNHIVNCDSPWKPLWWNHEPGASHRHLHGRLATPTAAVGRGPWFSGDVRWAHQKLRGFDQELYWDILVGGYHGDIVGCTNRMMLRCGQGIPSSWPLSPAFTLGYRSFSSASRQARHSFIQIDDVPMTNSWYPSIVIMCTSI